MNNISQTVADTSAQLVEQLGSSEINLWMIIAIVELIINIILLFSYTKEINKRSELKRKIMPEEEVDFANIMNSSFNAEKLYKDLIVKCHPDRFAPDQERMALANEITTLITKNKHDIKSLEALRDEAKNKLNINF